MIYKINFSAMGSRMFAALDGDSPKAAKRLEKVPVWFEEWEHIFSRFKQDSELSRINHHDGKPIEISQTFWDVLQLAKQVYSYSSGLITPTLLNAIETAGYDKNYDQLTSIRREEGFPTLLPSQSFEKLEMDEKTRTIYLPKDMRLDLGGVVKGWAAHTAMKRLQSYGATLINAGGDIAVSSLQSSGIPWDIGITDPQNPQQYIKTLFVGHCGIATSGRDFRRWQKNGIWQHHIIDPRTNQPSCTDLMAVTIIAKNAWEAEAAAKTVFLLGSAEGLAWLETHPSLAGLLIRENNQLIYSQHIEEYLRRKS